MSLTPPVRNTPRFAETRIEEQIRQRAYVLYEGCGTSDRNALGDWLQAKEEVWALRNAKVATSLPVPLQPLLRNIALLKDALRPVGTDLLQYPSTSSGRGAPLRFVSMWPEPCVLVR